LRNISKNSKIFRNSKTLTTNSSANKTVLKTSDEIQTKEKTTSLQQIIIQRNVPQIDLSEKVKQLSLENEQLNQMNKIHRKELKKNNRFLQEQNQEKQEFTDSPIKKSEKLKSKNYLENNEEMLLLSSKTINVDSEYLKMKLTFNETAEIPVECLNIILTPEKQRNSTIDDPLIKIIKIKIKNGSNQNMTFEEIMINAGKSYLNLFVNIL